MYTTYNLDFATKLPVVSDLIPQDIARNFLAGVGVKLVSGYSYENVQSTNSSLYTSASDYSYTLNLGFNGVRAGLISSAVSKGVKSKLGNQDVNFNPLKPQGSGFGFDLGTSAQILNYFKVGVSVTNIGWISWTKNVVNTFGDTSVTYSGFAPDQTNVPGSTSNLDSLKDAFNDYFANKDVPGSSVSTSLPTRFNIGVSMQVNDVVGGLPGQLLVGMDYHQGLNRTFGNVMTPEFIFGAEWKPVAFLPIRSAVGLGGAYGFDWSIGIGVDLAFYDFDLGIGTFNSVVAPTSAKAISLALNVLKFRF